MNECRGYVLRVIKHWTQESLVIIVLPKDHHNMPRLHEMTTPEERKIKKKKKHDCDLNPVSRGC